MKKSIMVLVLCMSLLCNSIGVMASENANFDISQRDSVDVGLECYEKIPVLTTDETAKSAYGLEKAEKTNVEKAREALLELKLGEQGLSYIEEACLAELDELENDPNCTLNEYTVLIPKTRATTPSYYATYSGRDYYSSLTSMSNITLEKNNSFGAYNNLKEWSKNAISLGLCFSNVLQVTIPWTLITATYPSGYTLHTSDWMESYINLNPTNRAIYAKSGTNYINLVNREYGPTRPYLVYHYNDATSPVPTKTIYHNYTTYPDITSSNRDTILYVAKNIYDSGANAVSYKLKNIVDLKWK